MIKEVNECTHGNYSSKCEKCPIIQNSDKMLCIHGISSNTCEKCLKNIEKINDEMICIHGRILVVRMMMIMMTMMMMMMMIT